MIQRFRRKGLERLFAQGDSRGVAPQYAGKLRHMLAWLDEATEDSLLNAPGYRLHRLKGGRSGQFSAIVSANWRLVFTFDGRHATDVDLIDYH